MTDQKNSINELKTKIQNEITKTDDVTTYRNKPIFVTKEQYDELIAHPNAPKVYDLLMPTMYGLLEDLTPGSALMDEFLIEWQKFEEHLNSSHELDLSSYGNWVFYPEKNHLVKYAPERWHKVALLIRNATLLYRPNETHNWQPARNKFDNLNIGFCGASVGSNILHAVNMLLRPKTIKVADCKDYQINNANRVRLSYEEFGRHKAEICAEQVHGTNPYTEVHVYRNGISRENIEQFILGSENENHKLDCIVEETDDPEAKLLIRAYAKKHGIPLIMATDIGYMAQVDIRRFDLDPDLPLTVGYTDEEVYERRNVAQSEFGNREKLLDFAFTMSGKKSIQHVEDFKQLVTGEIISDFGGVPQLGSTAIMAGGLAAWAISQILLGYDLPSRFAIDTKNEKFLTWGEDFEDVK